MKIILVGTAYPLRGGIAHYFALLRRHLSKRHDVETITFSRQYPAFLFPGTSQEETGPAGDQVPAARLIDSVNPFTWISAARAIAKKKPDVLIFKYWLPFFGPCFGTIAALVRRWTGAQTVFICDNVIPHERRIGDRIFTRFAFRFVDFFIVQSKSVEEDLHKFWPRARMAYVPHPVYEIFGERETKERARRKLKIPGHRIILFFGYVRKYKGLDVLLEAMPTIRKNVDVRLLVVGEFYHDERIYREKIRSLRIENDVTVVSDYVPNEDVGLWFSACDVVVLPYRSATQSGIAQIAYQFDKPVIATGVGGLSEVVLDNITGFIVPPEDPARLASAVIDFYGKKKEAAFVRGVRKEKKKYTWDSLVRAVEEFVVPGSGFEGSGTNEETKSKKRRVKSRLKKR